MTPVLLWRQCNQSAGRRCRQWPDAASHGAAGTPAYNHGVALIPLTNLGLMAEFSAAGVKFNFKPYGD